MMLFFTEVTAQPELQRQNIIRVMTYYVHNAVGLDNWSDVFRIAICESNADGNETGFQTF